MPPLDIVVGVDSLDAFMSTGLTQGIPGCSPPNFFAPVSSQVLSPTMHALYGLGFYDVFTTRLRSRNYNARLSSRRSRSMFFVVLFAIILRCCCHFDYENK